MSAGDTAPEYRIVVCEATGQRVTYDPDYGWQHVEGVTWESPYRSDRDLPYEQWGDECGHARRIVRVRHIEVVPR